MKDMLTDPTLRRPQSKTGTRSTKLSEGAKAALMGSLSIKPKSQQNGNCSSATTTKLSAAAKASLFSSLRPDTNGGSNALARGVSAPIRTVSSSMKRSHGSTTSMKRTMSFGGAKAHTMKPSESAPVIRKSVSFGTGQIRIVETVDEDQKNAVWYSPKELNSLRKHEVQQNKATEQLLSSQNNRKKVTIESGGDLTWRGMEDVKQGYNRVDRTRTYVHAVLTEFEMQAKSGYFDEYELRAVAKSLSKAERTAAQKVALKDYKMVLKEAAAEFVAADSEREEFTRSRSISGSTSWF